MSFASLADTVPREWLRPVAEWFIKELGEMITERDEEYEQMRLFGVSGIELTAHRRVTKGLNDKQDRWRWALNPKEQRAA